MLDYIVVGYGLSGLHFTPLLRKHKKSFIVFNDNSQCASKVSGGLYNPVILKRFTMAWNAASQMKQALPVYQEIAKELNTTIDFKIPVRKKFDAIEEQNNWFLAADKPVLSAFLSPDLHQVKNPKINAEYGLGTVLHTGRIAVPKLLAAYKSILGTNYNDHSFDYQALQIHETHVSYNGVKAKYIVFAEGFGLHKNPYFNTLPLNGTKGELLLIKAPELQLDYVYKAGVFIIPVGPDTYTVGATYNWNDKTNKPTVAAKTALLEKLDKYIRSDYQILDQFAGIRPTVSDRRPLLGKHPIYCQLAVLNGMGTRGVLLAPVHAKMLFHHLEDGVPIDEEVAIERFNKR